MKKFFLKIYILLIVSVVPLKSVYCEVYIIAKVNQEIITNIDLDFEKRYLVSLNPNLKKLDQNRIAEYAKNSLINEKIKKIEIEKRFKIIPNETLLSKIIGDIYSGIGISSLNEFKNYLSQNDVDIQRVREKILTIKSFQATSIEIFSFTLLISTWFCNRYSSNSFKLEIQIPE